MRPEYVAAVDAVRWGWTFWLIWLVPTIAIWWRTLISKRNTTGAESLKAFAISFAAGVVLFWILGVAHVRGVQAVKGRYIETPAEIEDWSSDLGATLAPITLVPIACGYSLFHSVAAFSISVFLGTKRKAAEFMQ